MIDHSCRSSQTSGSTAAAESCRQAGNVSFRGEPWTTDISHGELIRAGYDQRLEIDPCRLQFLYQGMDPTVDPSSEYSQLPWRSGLLTQTNSAC